LFEHGGGVFAAGPLAAQHEQGGSMADAWGSLSPEEGG
jgi:hypothetical protein